MLAFCAVLLGSSLSIAVGVQPFLAQEMPNGSGEVIIETSPPGLSIFLDGKLAGSSPVHKLLAEGTHTYSVKCSRSGNLAKDFNVTAGRIGTYSISCFTPLHPTPEIIPARVEASSNFILETSPTGLRVEIDGKFQGKTPVQEKLSPGLHNLSVKCPGVRLPSAFEIENGVTKSYVLACNETGASPALGEIVIETQPPGLKLAIDGAPRGRSPVDVTLATGRHTYVVACPYDGNYTQPVIVHPKAKKNLLVVCDAQE